MSTDWHVAAFQSALRAIEDGPPKNLIARAQPDAADHGTDLSASDLTRVLQSIEGTSAFLSALGMQVHKWDAAASSEQWTGDTSPSTAERRQLICQLLGLDHEGADELLNRRPIYHDSTVVITADWNRWYDSERASERSFYWGRYRSYLIDVKNWPESSVLSLDIASTEVMERLCDPTRPEAYQSKGLVVGYVQSGKTANFTGVVAKAIDAGYRLVIVMTGTIEMLRAQTQRRIDMEMVGRQNILGDLSQVQAVESGVDYQDDVDWINGRFLDLGQTEVATEIRRLTHHRRDYQSQFRTLKIERFDAGKPLFDPDNLFRTGARLAVVKKNVSVLRKLVNDIRANRTAFAEIPVLIIDDESDQASVNTVDPERVQAARAERREIRERRAINEHIAAMLELMPRAQYVGYTATPFANVFVDPSDELGIFPKDFVIGLSRPAGYMGVDDFHDFEEVALSPRNPSNSNEAAFVRNLYASEDDEGHQNRELGTAIDMFVLTGAVKLYRSEVDPALRFRHHTMLVHHSVRTQAQWDLAERVKETFAAAEFASPATRERLKELYARDLYPVTEARKEMDIPELPEFEVLAPYVARAVGRITEHNNNPVIVVNSDRDVQRQQQALDFDRYGTWRILVGGAKLSRGFTVEGLTVTYFRRATNMRDSLTQMGRWFGFRHGYRDLVRLFIARQARFGRKTVDLYEAFESIALDEAAFRAQLERYSEWEGDAPKVRPSQIPPLVQQHLDWLRPTARNKMFNAVLVEQREQPFTPTGYVNTVSGLKANLNLWRSIIQEATTLVSLPSETRGRVYEAYVGQVDAASLISALEESAYLPLYRERSIEPRVEFYRRLWNEGELRQFLVILPQPSTEYMTIDQVGQRAIVRRDRRSGRGGKFGEMTDKHHRLAVERFVVGEPSVPLESLYTPQTGAVLVYLAREQHPSYEGQTPHAMAQDPELGIVVASSVYVPDAAIQANPIVPEFRVLDPSQGDAPIINALEPNNL